MKHIVILLLVSSLSGCWCTVPVRTVSFEIGSELMRPATPMKHIAK